MFVIIIIIIIIMYGRSEKSLRDCCMDCTLVLTGMPVRVVKKSWNGCKFPENALLPILLYRSIWEKFPEDWHLWVFHIGGDLNYYYTIHDRLSEQPQHCKKVCNLLQTLLHFKNKRSASMFIFHFTTNDNWIELLQHHWI